MKTIESVIAKLDAKKNQTIDLNQKLPFVAETTVAAPISVVSVSTNETLKISSSKCNNCGNTEGWGRSTFCPECGFYPPTGQIYPGFVKDDAGEESLEEITHWSQVIPSWAWLTGSGVIVIILCSIIVGMNIKYTQLATNWSMIQFGLSICGVIISHIMAYFYSLHKTDEFGVYSLMLKPFKMWNWVYRALPHSQSEFNCAIWSLTAMLSAPLFIHMIEFDDITDLYKVRRSTKGTLEETVQKHVKEGTPDGSLEDAVNEFSEKAGSKITNLAAMQEKLPKPVIIAPVEDALIETDCVVIGFVLDKFNKPTHLVLAATVNGSLQYVGTVDTQDLSAKDIKDFTKRAAILFRPRPLIPAPIDAFWLKPVIAVRIVHKNWTPSKKLVEPKIKEMLAEISADAQPKDKPVVEKTTQEATKTNSTNGEYVHPTEIFEKVDPVSN